jgi:hypothetical protein
VWVCVVGGLGVDPCGPSMVCKAGTHLDNMAVVCVGHGDDQGVVGQVTHCQSCLPGGVCTHWALQYIPHSKGCR